MKESKEASESVSPQNPTEEKTSSFDDRLMAVSNGPMCFDCQEEVETKNKVEPGEAG